MLPNIARRSLLKIKNRDLKALVTFFQEKKFLTTGTDSKIIRCKLPDVSFPNVFVEEIVFKDLGRRENKIAVECATTGRRYSYLEIYKKSRALANVLHRMPTLKQHDTIAIVLPNIPEYPIIMLGAIQAGLKVSTVNPTYTSDEIARQLKDSDSKLVFTISNFHSKVDQAIQSLPKQSISNIVVNHEQNHTPSGAINFKDLINGDHHLSFKITRDIDETTVLPYSSGTTGLPKGVQITNRNIVVILTLSTYPEFSYFYNENDTVPAILPFFHIYGMVINLLSMLVNGCKLVTMATFDPNFFIEVLDKHRPTVGYVVPPIVLLMVNHPGIKQEHLSRFKTLVSGAAPLGAKDIQRLQEKSKTDLSIIQGYGLTETTSGICAQSATLENGIKFGGAGFALRNTEFKIVSVDDENRILGANETGELVVKGPQVMKGYLNNVKETQEVLDSEGWFRTGDIGYYDEDQHFFITDRLKELIKVKGFQVAPAELEEILRSNPDVADAGVIGIPHETFGEVPKAFIIPKKGVKIEPNNIQNFVANKVAKHKQLLGGIVVVDSIPKSATGKILRRALRDM